MKVTLLLFLIFVNPAFSSVTKILSCPKEITCVGKSITTCKLSDNMDNTWRISGSGGSLLPGRYKFIKALHYNYSNPEFCHFRLEGSHFAEVSVNAKFSIFKPKLVDSMWKKNASGSSFGLDCSYNSDLCLWEEEPGIIIEHQSGYPNIVFFYIDNETGSYKYTKKLLYKDLYNICGVTSDCIIALGIPNFDTASNLWFEYYGTINIDISTSNEITVKKINPDSSKPECRLLKHAIFNALYCKQ